MAGGKGTRLRPLTYDMPKPMVRMANRPMMEHVVRLLARSSFRDIIVTLCYLPEKIQSYFDTGERFGVDLRYSIEETALGTAGSVKKVEKDLGGTFLVISGDALTDINLAPAIEFHRSKGAMATILLTRVENPLEYGVVITEKDGRIRQFLEKPGWGEVFSDTVNTGIYVLEPDVLEYVEPGTQFDFSKDLFPLLLKNRAPVLGYVVDGYWCDVGTLDQYRKSHNDILNSHVKVDIDGEQIQEGVFVGVGTHLDDGVRISGPCIIGSDCIIEKDVEIGEFTVIGSGSALQRGASLRRTILMDKVYVSEGAELRGCIVDNRVMIKPRAMILEGAVIGHKATIGEKAIVRPQVRIWPEKTVEDAVTVSTNLIWGTRCSRRLFGANGVSGVLNAEITPEFAARLAAAFGSAIPAGKDGDRAVVVSCDAHGPSRMLKRAIIAGLLSCGVDVFDLGHITTPVSRYAVGTLGAQGGIHIRMAPTDPGQILFEFLDSMGINISRGLERNIETIFFNDDFQRSPSTQIGEVAFLTKVAEQYLEGLLRQLNVDAIRQRRFKVAVDYDPGSLSLLLPSFFERLGCEVVMVGGAMGQTASAKTAPEIREALSGIKKLVKDTSGDVGVVVDNNAERLLLVDELGREIAEDTLLVLMSILSFKAGEGSRVAVPVTAPGVIETLAKVYKGQVIRTKADPRSIMEKTIEQRIFTSDHQGPPTFQPAFDALMMFGKVLEVLAEEKLTLSSLVSMIPEFYMSKSSIGCPWESKGKIMRTLIENTDVNSVELIDGVKIHQERGWALVLPDSDHPELHIVSEAQSPDEAAALQNLIMSKISEIQQKDQP